MYVIREILHCKPGKVRPMLEKFRAVSELLEEMGHEPFRLLTDVSGEPFWTLVVEATVGAVDDFLALEAEMGANEAFRETMAGYHDLIQDGRREIYKLESDGAERDGDG